MPFILMGIVSLLAAILAFFLPETAGIKLPDTVEEAEVLFQRKNFLKKNSDKIPPVKLGMRGLKKETEEHLSSNSNTDMKIIEEIYVINNKQFVFSESHNFI